MEALLLKAVSAEEEAARLCAAQWAQRLFAFDHVTARYVCIMAAGDKKLEVREAGLAGLRPPKLQPGMSAPCSACLFADLTSTLEDRSAPEDKL